MQDYAKPAQLNRLDWYPAHGWQVAYPGDARIGTLSVPGGLMFHDRVPMQVGTNAMWFGADRRSSAGGPA